MRQAVEVAELASEQWGLVTTAQAGVLGVSSQTMAALANDGAAERLTHGVYRMTGAPPRTIPIPSGDAGPPSVFAIRTRWSHSGPRRTFIGSATWMRTDTTSLSRAGGRPGGSTSGSIPVRTRRMTGVSSTVCR